MIEENDVANDRDALKAKADSMGIDYVPNIPTAKLQELVDGHKPTQAKLTPSQRRKAKVDEAMKLVRVRVACLNPSKKEIKHEFFRVANSLCKAHRLVPFDTDTHIENILLEHIQSRGYSRITSTTDAPHPSFQVSNEFQVTILPPLTEAELKRLAEEQTRSGRLE